MEAYWSRAETQTAKVQPAVKVRSNPEQTYHRSSERATDAVIAQMQGPTLESSLATMVAQQLSVMWDRHSDHILPNCRSIPCQTCVDQRGRVDVRKAPHGWQGMASTGGPVHRQGRNQGLDPRGILHPDWRGIHQRTSS